MSFEKVRARDFGGILPQEKHQGVAEIARCFEIVVTLMTEKAVAEKFGFPGKTMKRSEKPPLPSRSEAA
jgi:hypothetical protein